MHEPPCAQSRASCADALVDSCIALRDGDGRAPGLPAFFPTPRICRKRCALTITFLRPGRKTRRCRQRRSRSSTFLPTAGKSHVDTFDPKPSLEKYAGKLLPMENLATERKTGAAYPSPFKFQKYGKSGIEVSEIFSKVAENIDDICVIRSMAADVPNHEPSLMLMNCGDATQIRPSMESWVTYGLGSMNQNLPGFISMCPGGYPIQESQNWQAGFLPGVYQGTYVDTAHTKIEELIQNIKSDYTSMPEQRQQLGLAPATERTASEKAEG